MRSTMTIRGRELRVSPPALLGRIRRLAALWSRSEAEPHLRLAAVGAILGEHSPDLPDPRAYGHDLIDYGDDVLEQVGLHAGSTAEMVEAMTIACELLVESIDRLPSAEAVEDTADFSTAPTADRTPT